MPQFGANFHDNNNNMPAHYSSSEDQMNYVNPPLKNESSSFGSMDSLEMQSNQGKIWPFDQDDVADDLQSVAFRYIHH